MELYHLNSAFPLVETLYGVEVNPQDYEELAIIAWEQIGNKHTRLYRYKGEVKDGELQLPCNVENIEAVTIPVSDAQFTSPDTNFINLDNAVIERYIDHLHTIGDPMYVKGKYVQYRQAGDKLYFNRDFHNVMILYTGIIADGEDGLPMINHREMKAIAAFVAYTEMYKDGLKKRDKNTIQFAMTIKEEWLRKCNAARSVDYISQNDMDAILDAKSRWDRKQYGKSLKPIR